MAYFIYATRVTHVYNKKNYTNTIVLLILFHYSVKVENFSGKMITESLFGTWSESTCKETAITTSMFCLHRIQILYSTFSFRVKENYD